MFQEPVRLLLILFTPTGESLKSLTLRSGVYIIKLCLFLSSPGAN